MTLQASRTHVELTGVTVMLLVEYDLQSRGQQNISDETCMEKDLLTCKNFPGHYLTSCVRAKDQMLNEILISAAFRREIASSLFSDKKEEE